jgi:hypothetical protein
VCVDCAYQYDPTNALLAVLAVLVAAFAAVRWLIYRGEEHVARCLVLAERDFNNLISGGMEHGGRKGRVQERRVWNTMADLPVIQINTDGYKSVAHELVAANEKELGGKSASMGKASITAFLLRELYHGEVEPAQLKIFAEARNNGGKLPYIAPGLDKLVGLDEYDPENGFPPHSGVPPWLLRRVVRNWHFPREIRMVKTDTTTGAKSYRPPFEALDQLLQQNL